MVPVNCPHRLPVLPAHADQDLRQNWYELPGHLNGQADYRCHARLPGGILHLHCCQVFSTATCQQYTQLQHSAKG